MEKKYCAYCGELLENDCGCDEYERDSRLPEYYAEIEYEDMDSAEAIDGSRFDDMNYRRYMER